MPLTKIFPEISAVIRLQGGIQTANNVAALATHAEGARNVAVTLARVDAGPALVTRVLSLLNDAITERVLQLHQSRFRLPPTRWCWLGLGSEGRLEQTLATDQDNGLLFSASDDGEARQLREMFLPFARAVNESLADCGFPLCDGEVMACNPRWCLSLTEWQEAFATWIRTPEPDALLNASIFFDFRLIAGDQQLAEALRQYLTDTAAGNEIFLRMMAVNALSAQPPLGRLRDFDSSEPDGRVDLKKFGSRIFVDAARILALGAGIAEAGTAERLQGVVASRVLSESSAAACVHAFHALQGIRFNHQMDADVADNLLDPNALNDFDRRILLEALRQAKLLQGKLKTRFHIDG